MQPTTTTYSEPSDADIKVSPLVGMTIRELLTAIAVGLGTGLVTAGITLVMNKFVFSAVLCRPEAAGSDCSNAPLYASIVAMIIGAIASLVVLAQLRTFRPLLAVIATLATLWGFSSFTAVMPWYWMVVTMMALFGLLYGLYLWVARVRSFLLAVILTVVLVVAIRYFLVA